MTDGIPWKMMTFADGINSITIDDNNIITVKEFNKELMRIFPNLCMAVS
jgi:hypothetical protein